MPLYLVRWPRFAVSLIQAKDEHDLLDTIDEIGDPSGCTWKIYKGPLHYEKRFGGKTERRATKSQKKEFEKAILAELRGFFELEFASRYPESQKPFERN